MIPVAFALKHSLAQPIHGLDFLACLANHADRTPLVMWWSTLCNISACYSYIIMAVNVFNSWSGNFWLSTYCTVIMQHCVFAPVFTFTITSSPNPASWANVHSNHDFTAPHWKKTFNFTVFGWASWTGELHCSSYNVYLSFHVNEL